jgi:hypothetical protein
MSVLMILTFVVIGISKASTSEDLFHFGCQTCFVKELNSRESASDKFIVPAFITSS